MTPLELRERGYRALVGELGQMDTIRFLRIAKGSAGELRTQCYLALKLELLVQNQCQSFIQECKEISAMLQGLIRARSRPT